MALRRRRGGAGEAAAGTDGAVPAPAPARSEQDRKSKKSGKGAGGRDPLTPARAKRMIAVGKVVAPLLAPYALAAAGVARAQWDDYRARRLGVSADQLGSYSGRGGALHARISRIAAALPELAAESQGRGSNGTGSDGRDEQARRFAAETSPRLADLSLAVRAAEQMPASRRRTAFRAVAGELDQIETGLLTHLGLRV